MGVESEAVEHPRSKAELLERFKRGWNHPRAAFAGLDDAALTERRDATGQAINDHLTHVTAWKRSLLYLLRGLPRHAGVGVAMRGAGCEEGEAL